jgi:hypothetical protein
VGGPSRASRPRYPAGRKTGNFASKLALHEFPYDVQLAQMVLESEHTNDTLRWVPSPTLVSGLLPSGVEMDGWDIVRAYYLQSDHFYPALEESYNRLTMLVRLRRQSAYYTTRIMANVVLMVIMGGCVAFLRGTEADRLGCVGSAHRPPPPPRSRLQCGMTASVCVCAGLCSRRSAAW